MYLLLHVLTYMHLPSNLPSNIPTSDSIRSVTSMTYKMTSCRKYL